MLSLNRAAGYLLSDKPVSLSIKCCEIERERDRDKEGEGE